MHIRHRQLYQNGLGGLMVADHILYYTVILTAPPRPPKNIALAEKILYIVITFAVQGGEMRKYVISIVLLALILPYYGLSQDKKNESDALLNAQLLSGLKFRALGPALMSGRISDIATHPKKRGIWYIAVGSGGVWKTSNGGVTWDPIFDGQSAYSIGCVTIDPSNHDIVWVGTGENVSGRHVGFGDGVYRSRNGGRSWENMGLKKSEHIAKIVIDPQDSNLVYVAAEGPLWSSGGERGVFKSENGGQTWQLVLDVSPNTGVTDLVMDPENPHILYAAAYQRRRSVAAFLAGGPESGIYKTENKGKDWRKLAVGLPGGDMGRIGLAVSPHETNVVYATIEAKAAEKGFYRSSDRGESWLKRSSYTSGGTGPHYYQEIFADPHKFDRVYQMDVWMHVTEDGGKTFVPSGGSTKHSDHHALAFDLSDPEYLLAGTDGGLYESRDQGQTWRYFANLPLTQFYKLALDNAEPFYNIHGGTQDNASQIGPSRTISINGIFNSDWFTTTGADGYACAIDPVDPDIIYAEWQNGSLNRFDKKSRELLDIKPQPGPDDPPDRWNWDAPVIISPFSHTRLYFAAQHVYRSENRGDAWVRISPDLTRNIFRYEQKIMGRSQSIDALWDHGAMSVYSTITSLAESPLQEGLIYVGTDDGLLQVTEDGGKNWRKISKIPGLPEYCFVNDIRACRHNKDTVFAALDNHKTGDFKPYLIKSEDRGRTWQSLTSDLPEHTIVWAITQDHKIPGLLFIGTEFGIHCSWDGGQHWTQLKGGLPPIPFRDLEIQERESDLVGASFGRGFFVLDDYSPLRHMAEEAMQTEALLFPVKKADHFIQSTPLTLRGKAFLGDGVFLAPNPPFGAVFTYYLKETLQTAADKRKDLEAQLKKAGKDISFPGWDRLRQEALEEKPAVILSISDSSGQVVRRLSGPVTKGIHRMVWDLRYPALDPTKLIAPSFEPWGGPSVGPLVVPGAFSVILSLHVGGEISQVGEARTFSVESMGLASLPAPDRKELLEFQQKVGEMQRVMMGAGAAAQEALRRLQYIKKAVLDAPKADKTLKATARRLEQELQKLQVVLYGDRIKRRRSEPTTPSLMYRLSAQLNSTSSVTDTNRRNYKIAANSLEGFLAKLRQVIDIELRNLEEKLEAAGTPWTPGRSVPKWKKK